MISFLYLKYSNMPVNTTPSPNMVLLNRILKNQEMIIAKMNGLKDDMTKLELTTNNLLCKNNIQKQRIEMMESKIDEFIRPKGWIF